MHRLIGFKELPQGFRPVSSGLPVSAAGNIAAKYAKALIVKVGQRYSIYIPVEKKAEAPVLLSGASTVLSRLVRS